MYSICISNVYPYYILANYHQGPIKGEAEGRPMEFRSVCCEIYIDCKEREGLITASDDDGGNHDDDDMCFVHLLIIV